MSVPQIDPRAQVSRVDAERTDDFGTSTDLSILAAVNVVLRRRRLVLGVALALVLVVIVLTLLQPRQYTSSASFMPQARRASTGSGGLAAQFGLSVLTADASQSPSFYLDLLTSRNILDSVVTSRYAAGIGGGSGGMTLVDLLHARGRTPGIQREDAVRRLRRVIRADASPKTGVVAFSVRAEDPVVAREVTERLLQLLNTFNLQTRRTQASEERQFAERRLGEVAQELRDAEDRQQAFLQRNRAYENSPELRFAQDRLARDVTMRQQLYTSLAQSYEQAKMDEVRDTPVITVVEAPDLPVEPDSRGLLTRIAAAMFVGLVIGVGLAFVRELLSRDEEGREDVGEFRTLWHEALTDVSRPWRLLKKPSGRKPQ